MVVERELCTVLDVYYIYVFGGELYAVLDVYYIMRVVENRILFMEGK